MVHEVASAGSVLSVSRLMWIKSALRQRITSREGSSTARTGLSVFGSERKATEMLPPNRPGGALVTASSSPVCVPEANAATHTNATIAEQTRAWRHPYRALLMTLL